MPAISPRGPALLDAGAAPGAAEPVAGEAGGPASVSPRPAVDTAARLRDNAQTFHTLIANNPFGVFVLDASLRLRHVSKDARRVFQNAQPLEERDFAEVVYILWDDPFAGAALARLRHTLETGEPFAAPGTVQPRKDIPEVGTFDWYVERITLPDGQPGVVCYFYDLTERVRLQRALQAADRRKDEFLATLAHELRNPLAPLRNGLHLARRLSGAGEAGAHPGAGEAGLSQVVEVMDRQLSHLVRLVDDLLDVGRIVTGKLELRLQPLRVDHALAGSVEACRSTMDARGQHLVVEGGSSRLVLGDFHRLVQVFTNLVANASKYSDAGATITVTLAADGEADVVRIMDQGVGIPAGHLDSVFDLFSQVQVHQGLSRGGLGIGLSLVKTLVELHGGRVEAASEGPGRGSTFTVRLPVMTRAQAAVVPGDPAGHAGADAPPAPGASHRVLIVDDNVDAADTLGALLRPLGHAVWIAHDGAAAVRCAAAVQPELVLLDLGMPGIDGFETARRLRALPCGTRMRIAALTGWGQPSDRQRTRDAGFDHHFVKPADLDTLTALIALLEDGKPAVSTLDA